MTNRTHFRVLQFVHRSQNIASNLRVPITAAAIGLLYAFMVDVIEKVTAGMQAPEPYSAIIGELRGIRRRADDESRQEESQ